MIIKREVNGLVDLRPLLSEVLASAGQQGLRGNALVEAKLTMEESLIQALKQFGSSTVLLVVAE